MFTSQDNMVEFMIMNIMRPWVKIALSAQKLVAIEIYYL